MEVYISGILCVIGIIALVLAAPKFFEEQQRISSNKDKIEKCIQLHNTVCNQYKDKIIVDDPNIDLPRYLAVSENEFMIFYLPKKQNYEYFSDEEYEKYNPALGYLVKTNIENILFYQTRVVGDYTICEIKFVNRMIRLPLKAYNYLLNKIPEKDKDNMDMIRQTNNHSIKTTQNSQKSANYFDSKTNEILRLKQVLEMLKSKKELNELNAKNIGAVPREVHETTVHPFSVADEILKFKQLLDMGVITQEEFEKKKKELLG